MTDSILPNSVNLTSHGTSPPVMQLAQYALAYARMGYRVFPLRPDNPFCQQSRCDCKAPLTEHGLNDATTDENTIFTWWHEWPNANIGIACKASGIVAIDLDTHEQEKDGFVNFGILRGSNVLPTTPMQKTPGGFRGGAHILFRHPTDVDLVGELKITDLNSGQSIDSGIQIKSNGYIVAVPSSIHGKMYSQWQSNGQITPCLLDGAPVEMPDWLKLIATRKTSTISVSQESSFISETDRKLVLEALELIPADNYETWLRLGMALKAYGFTFEIWDRWSQKSSKYSQIVCERKWSSFNREGIKIGTVFKVAQQHGFKFPEGYFGLTDIGNAQRLSMHYGHRLRWHRASKSWLVWDGMRWKKDDTEMPQAFAKETALTMMKQGVESGNAKLLKHAHTSAQSSKIDAMLKLAKDKLAVIGSNLDSNPYLLNCLNGTVDLRTGKLRPHNPEDLITRLAPVNFNPFAPASRFTKFLSEIFAGSNQLITFVQRFMGYSITGSVKEEKMVICHGGGSNGKSTLIGAIQAVIGDYSHATDPTLLVSKRQEGASEDVHKLKGVRFASTIETDEGVQLSEAKVKHLTGGDKLTARPLFGHLEEFEPTHKIWLATNHLPRIKGQDAAIWRRLILVPFSVSALDPIKDADKIADMRSQGKTPLIKDKDLKERLKEEYEGILSWLIQGCLDWQREGLAEPSEVMVATTVYKDNEDTLAKFIDDRCYVEADASATASNLRNAYIQWCRSNGEAEINQDAFKRRLKDKGFTHKKTKECNRWLGIGLSVEGTEISPSTVFSNFAPISEVALTASPWQNSAS